MSAYLKITTGVEGICEMMLPDVNVHTGTFDQLSQHFNNISTPCIGIVDDLVFRQDEPSASTKRTTLEIDFLLPDAFESSSKETQNIIASTDILIDQFLVEIENLYDFYGISIGEVTRVPQRKKYSGTFSGMSCIMILDIGVCDDNIFPDMKTFQDYIGRKISPYKWYGITQRDSNN